MCKTFILGFYCFGTVILTVNHFKTSIQQTLVVENSIIGRYPTQQGTQLVKHCFAHPDNRAITVRLLTNLSSLLILLSNESKLPFSTISNKVQQCYLQGNLNTGTHKVKFKYWLKDPPCFVKNVLKPQAQFSYDF